MKCPYCRGRGWNWWGVGDNAERLGCGPCAKTGKGRLDWTPVWGLVCIGISAAITLFALIMIWYALMGWR